MVGLEKREEEGLRERECVALLLVLVGLPVGEPALAAKNFVAFASTEGWFLRRGAGKSRDGRLRESADLGAVREE